MPRRGPGACGAGLFEDLALGYLGGVVVRTEVPTGVLPPTGLVVADQQDPVVVVEHDGGHGEMTDVGHKAAA